MFNIFLYDLFYEYENKYFANYADDSTPYIAGDNITDVLKICKLIKLDNHVESICQKANRKLNALPKIAN